MALSLFFVDCEADGPAPGYVKPDGRMSVLTEFGSVHYPSREIFHGVLFEATPDPANPCMSLRSGGHRHPADQVFRAFAEYLKATAAFGQSPKLISDNPAYDWQWINHGFWTNYGSNPFGHSARRIGDYYAGLVHDFGQSSRWKRLRVTKHDHHPVHDAMGNLEAFERMLKGERAK